MNIPRIHSDPGPSRLDSLWRQTSPRLPSKVYIQPIPQVPVSLRNHESRPNVPQVRSIGVSAQEQMRSIGINTELPRAPEVRKKRNWFMKVIMTPCDLLAWGLKKWCQPNENCINCIKVTYWLVLIVAGIIGAVVAIAPFL